MSVQPLTYYGPAPVDNEGVLREFVLQPVDGALQKNSDGTSNYKEQWKGPWETGKMIQIYPGDTMLLAHATLGINRVYRFEAPPCPHYYGQPSEWIVQDVSVTELEAGAHCIINLTYSDIQTNLSAVFEDLDKRNWSVSWQSYTVSPYAFCSNTDHYDHSITDPMGSSDQYQLPAMRSHIDSYRMASPNDKIHSADNTVTVYKSNGNQWYLNDTERAILKKVELGKSALYHYPVVTYTRIFHGNKYSDFSETLGCFIDVICDLPSNCPYHFNDQWKWLKVGQDVTRSYDKNLAHVTYEVREVYWGSKYIDPNFYGEPALTWEHTEDQILSGRWEEGKL